METELTGYRDLHRQINRKRTQTYFVPNALAWLIWEKTTLYTG